MARKDDAITCKVKEFRLGKGWSQQELADRIDVRRQAIYDIESGRYLPNTAIALRLARIFGCRVEELFVEHAPPETEPVHLVDDTGGSSTRLALGRVRNRLVGLPLQGAESIPFGLRSADGLLNPDKKSAYILSSSDRLEKTIILMGCDPAFDILGHHVTRLAPEARVHCRFASSHRALNGLAEGVTHVAGTHLHNTGKTETNVVVASQKLVGMRSRVMGFSLLEEGLMVARHNPLGIRSVADLAQPMVRFVNREQGAALRVLLDDQLQQAGIAGSAVEGYENEVTTHREGAYRIACNVADAALGLRAIAEAFNLSFVPITAARCDLVIPTDITSHPTVRILLDVLQSAALRREIDAIPGYEGSVTGTTIAVL
ncbi:substrate-binding domain-containing protein [uncultured Desulfosarcina sp.]|uniref:substrate-binding domain-containing protein n=1 Tax=uncultured Desulfosarcina sp. TaxID=218289 RepID=UPI0029C6F511|nr:substrate-binding domain-containing protein [uncultured Desulfosarcina sp.]